MVHRLLIRSLDNLIEIRKYKLWQTLAVIQAIQKRLGGIDDQKLCLSIASI